MSNINIYIDFDGTIVNTIKKIVELYNDDFVFYENFKPINWVYVDSWEFNELEAATPKYIDEYFNQPRFFTDLEMFPYCGEILMELANKHKITIVSMGNTPNLKLKKLWIKQYLPFCDFIGVNFKEYSDKAHIDMSDGIFIDDVASNLTTSNAAIKMCFGDEYSWNKDWAGLRCANWCDVWRFFDAVEKK